MQEKKESALNRIQRELKAPKSQRNKFGNYNYRSCEDILEAVKPLLGDAVLTISDEIVLVGDRYYVKATVTLVDGSEFMSVSAFAREQLDHKLMSEPQITGATSSYARKYALNGLFCIDDTKDADSPTLHVPPVMSSIPKPVVATPIPIPQNKPQDAPGSKEAPVSVSKSSDVTKTPEKGFKVISITKRKTDGAFFIEFAGPDGRIDKLASAESAALNAKRLKDVAVTFVHGEHGILEVRPV